MKLVRVERLLGGGRLIFYFMAEGRVDFRERPGPTQFPRLCRDRV